MPHMERVALFVVAVTLGSMPQVPRDNRATTPAATGTAVIAGRVTIDVNGTLQPVRRARLTLESEALTKLQTTDTDTDGRYRFDKLPAGAYRMRAEKAGFVPQLRDPRRAFEKPAEFNLTAGMALNLSLAMVRGAALEGRILIDTGAPAVNVVVSAMRFSYDATGRRATAVRQARTDDRGKYRVHSLPAGEYYIDAAPDPLDAMRQAPVPGRRPSMLARTFYPGAPRIEGGQTITLATGQDVTSLDFALPTVPTAALRGKILDSTAAPAKTMAVRIQRVGGPVGEVRGEASPDGGDFTYRSVPAGEYWLTGVARPSPAADLEFAAARVNVSGQDMSNLSLTTAKGAVVNGRIEVEGGPPPALDALQVVAHETEFELPTQGGSTALTVLPAAVALDSAFSFSSLFGPRLFRFNRLPAGWTLKSVSLDGADVTDAPVDFRGGDTPLTLRIVITSRTSSVSGVVRDEAGRALNRARVVVFSEDDKAWGWRSRMVRVAESGADGRYTIDGLLDGKYHIVAAPFLEDGSWMDATILRRLQTSASSITVADAQKLTTNLVVKP